MAGLEIANIIANDKCREKFKSALIAAGIHNPGYFSVPAFLCAYRHGDSWLAALRLFSRKQELGSILLPDSFSRTGF